ncbi:hypothetical protein D9M68_649370 [compost metagenome]
MRRCGDSTLDRESVIGNGAPDVLELVTGHPVAVVLDPELPTGLSGWPSNLDLGGVGIPAVGDQLDDGGCGVGHDSPRIAFEKTGVV